MELSDFGIEPIKKDFQLADEDFKKAKNDILNSFWFEQLVAEVAINNAYNNEILRVDKAIMSKARELNDRNIYFSLSGCTHDLISEMNRRVNSWQRLNSTQIFNYCL